MQSEYIFWTRNPQLGVPVVCVAMATTFVAFSPVGSVSLRTPHFSLKRLTKPICVAACRAFNRRTTHVLEMLNATRKIAAELNCGVPSLAFAWVLAQGDHVVSNPGTTSNSNIGQNFSSLELTISEAVLTQLNEVYNPEVVAGNRYSDTMYGP